MLVGAVIASNQQVSIRIQHLDDRIQRKACAVHVEPNLCAGGTNEAVYVLIVCVAEDTADRKAQRQVFVRGRFVFCQSSEELCRDRRIIRSWSNRVHSFNFQNGQYVAIIAKRIEQRAAPIACAWYRSDAVIVCVGLWPTIGLCSRTDRVISQTCKHHRKAWLANNLNSPAHSVRHAAVATRGRDSRPAFLIEIGALALELDDQRFIDRTLQTQSTTVFQIRHRNRIEQNVNNIGVVPNALRGQNISLQISNRQYRFIAVVCAGIASNFQAIDAVVEQSVFSEQRSLIGVQRHIATDRSRLPTRIASQNRIHRIRIDGDRSSRIVLEYIIHNNRL